ncbi:ISAzo13 family transposase [Nonomuraea basaltis]|uniref:ISAzo13 family transposase n=1 Tax=Nonomuraea basaltis TaxID=2495887 RepID=UPI00110C4070|nr:ISAzo13 family transposase [Nonomuraea basaltis]TMR87953.1 ISAzo13 family transposase [Nonomuraea basaltis]
MAIPSEVREQLSVKFDVLLPHLNERQRRLLLATEARLLGHGGVRTVAQVAGVSETTIRNGVFELEAGDNPLPAGRVRKPGGGRKAAEDQDLQLVPALLALVEPDERGDPMSPLRWTTKSLRNLAEELARQGHSVSAPTVGRLLKGQGFSLQANTKTLEGKQHPDRDAQFGYVNEQVKEHQTAGQPVISVDTKKKEQLGQLPNAGRQWRPKGDPVQVEDHSFFFTGPDVPHAIPYGIYDLAADRGWVNVGVDHDTSAFAVASIRRWWHARGRTDYMDASRLLITADCGGSNSYRYRAWKAELADFAAETGLTITVCHFPPGTSKWNKIEHRLFSHITMNWRGRPLTSHKVVVNSIAATRTRTGLRVEAELDSGAYPLGVSVSTERMNALPIRPHAQRGMWNYTISPTADHITAAVQPGDRDQIRARALHTLADPRLTGMGHQELQELAIALAPAQAARAEQRYFERRGGPRRQAKGIHGRSLLSDADKVLLTLVYQRQICSQRVLSEMIEVNTYSIGTAIAETAKLLAEHKHTTDPTVLRFTSVAALRTFLDSDTMPARPNRLAALGDPALTGMHRPELERLIKRLSKRQAAEAERRKHLQRGGDRQPTARGGVFNEKITDAERVLAVILGLRKVCSWDVVAELFQVSRRTIGNARTWVRPLLEQEDRLPERAPIRYRTAADLLARAPESRDTPTS